MIQNGSVSIEGMCKWKEIKIMNKKLIKLNYRVVISMLAILAFAATLAFAPMKKSTGDVQVRLENGNLIIRGDDQDNNIIITESGVSGRAGTTVNGERHIFIPEGVTNDLEISMRGGDDFVRVELPGTNFAIPHDLELNMGPGNDIIELLQVRAPNETRIDTGNGNDIVFIDGVLGVNEFIRSEFTGKFALKTGNGEDLFEFHHTTFRSEVDVKLGSGIDGSCNTEDSEFQMPNLASFNGGAPNGFPGDGFVAPSTQFTNITGFENFPDDCSFLGGRF
jgi:hypothetical protein